MTVSYIQKDKVSISGEVTIVLKKVFIVYETEDSIIISGFKRPLGGLPVITITDMTVNEPNRDIIISIPCKLTLTKCTVVCRKLTILALGLILNHTTIKAELLSGCFDRLVSEARHSIIECQAKEGTFLPEYPKTGAFILHQPARGGIITFLVPADAGRLQGLSTNIRVSKAKVLAINASDGMAMASIEDLYIDDLVYNSGETYYDSEFQNNNPFNEHVEGIQGSIRRYV